MLELPFTATQFLDIFRDYNNAIWPAQGFAYLFGIIAVVLGFRPLTTSGRIISVILGFFWLWIGIIYHLMFFSAINKAAYVFGALFIIQGLLFLFAGFATRKLRFQYRNDVYGITGIALIGYAMIIYPIIGYYSGHAYPFAPMFGVAPCPATIFTFGLLLWTKARVPVWLFTIPAIWSIIGSTAAIKLGIHEDLGLALAGIVTVYLLMYRDHQSPKLQVNNTHVEHRDRKS
ncbi:MAG: DUF6064 family protein [Balneolaceae bacterium]|jgi:hypothetical protein